MLDFKDVVFQFPVEEKPIIDHLSFHVNRGEFISIIGASGCGKSTIFRLINRLLTPENGEILVAGRRVAGKPSADPGREDRQKAVREKSGKNVPVCGYMPQQDLLFPL
jgi:putative hydroxymethylpyrimidine transport system ATP-binding protein